MSVAELQPGYEEVFTVLDYYDGPRKGIASFKGQPHFYDCIFDERKGDYSDLFRLTPVPQSVFQLAMEDWAIWRKWEQAYANGKATIDTHPALPEDRERHEQLKPILDSALVSSECSMVRVGHFDPIGKALGPAGVMRNLQVRWSEAQASSS